MHYITDYTGEQHGKRKIINKFRLDSDTSINRYYELPLTESVYKTLVHRIRAYNIYIENPDKGQADGDFHIVDFDSSRGAAANIPSITIICTIFRDIDKSTKWDEAFKNNENNGQRVKVK